jgi:hypothetical protein
MTSAGTVAWETTVGGVVVHGVGSQDVLARPALAVVGSRMGGAYQSLVAAHSVHAASGVPAVIWVRLSPSGPEDQVVERAVELQVPAVAVCAAGVSLLPDTLVEQVVSTGGAVISTGQLDAPADEASAAARDLLVATVPSALVAVDGTVADSPDTIATVGVAARAGTGIIVARPKTGHRRGRSAQLAQILSGRGSLSKLGWSPDEIRSLARHDPPAHAVCDDPDQLEAAITMLVRFGSRSSTHAVRGAASDQPTHGSPDQDALPDLAADT